MKQLILMVCMMLAASCADGQEYVISGEVQGADGQTVTLKNFSNMQPADLNTTTVKSGKFTLKGTMPVPDFCLLYVGDNGPVQLFVENAKIRVQANLENMEQSTITGSKENDVFAEFMGKMSQYATQQQQLNDQYTALSTSAAATQEAVANIRTQYEQLQTERQAYALDFVQKNSGKVAAAFIAYNSLMQALNIEQLEQLVNSFGGQLQQSQWVQMLAEQVTSVKRTAVGQPFPDITLTTPDDQPMSISDYAGKGKYVLLDFWAAWCGPCRNANPRVVELYKRYKDKGFEIVGISLDRGKKEWVDAIAKDGLTWPQMSDLKYWQSAAAKLYSVSSIPHTVLIDKEGKIIAKGLHVDALAAKLAELFD